MSFTLSNAPEKLRVRPPDHILVLAPLVEEHVQHDAFIGSGTGAPFCRFLYIRNLNKFKVFEQEMVEKNPIFKKCVR